MLDTKVQNFKLASFISGCILTPLLLKLEKKLDEWLQIGLRVVKSVLMSIFMIHRILSLVLYKSHELFYPIFLVPSVWMFGLISCSCLLSPFDRAFDQQELWYIMCSLIRCRFVQGQLICLVYGWF